MMYAGQLLLVLGAMVYLLHNECGGVPHNLKDWLRMRVVYRCGLFASCLGVIFIILHFLEG